MKLSIFVRTPAVPVVARKSRARRLCRDGGLLAGSLLLAAAGAWALDRAAWEHARSWTCSLPEGAPRMAPVLVSPPDHPPIRTALLSAGTTAPDFELPDVRDGYPVRLSGLRGHAVVLVFGSFGCNLLCEATGELARLHSRYGDRAQFLFVYIAEAPHENPNLPPPWGGARATDPAGAQRERIGKGLAHYGLTMPCLDDRDGKAREAYGAWPRRVVVVDAGGRIAHDAGLGVLGSSWDLDAVGKVLGELSAREKAGKPSPEEGPPLYGIDRESLRMAG